MSMHFSESIDTDDTKISESLKESPGQLTFWVDFQGTVESEV